MFSFQSSGCKPSEVGYTNLLLLTISVRVRSTVLRASLAATPSTNILLNALLNSFSTLNYNSKNKFNCKMARMVT